MVERENWPEVGARKILLCPRMPRKRENAENSSNASSIHRAMAMTDFFCALQLLIFSIQVANVRAHCRSEVSIFPLPVKSTYCLMFYGLPSFVFFSFSSPPFIYLLALTAQINIFTNFHSLFVFFSFKITPSG